MVFSKVANRWNQFSKSRKNIAIVNLFKKNFLIGRIPILHLHLAGRESIKMRIDVNKVTRGLSMRMLEHKVILNQFHANDLF